MKKNVIRLWKSYQKGYSQLIYECMECGHQFHEGNFCPNCGIQICYESTPKRITTPSGYFYATETTIPKIYKWGKYGAYSPTEWIQKG